MPGRVYVSYMNSNAQSGLPWISMTAMAFLLIDKPVTPTQAAEFIAGRDNNYFSSVYASVWLCIKKMDEAGWLITNSSRKYRLSAQGRKLWNKNLAGISRTNITKGSDSKAFA